VAVYEMHAIIINSAW